MNFWYKPKMTLLALLLYPFSELYQSLAKNKYKKDLKHTMNPDSIAQQIVTPIIVVGNITVGGTGKTPMVRFLMQFICAMGFKVGVISRGYGGSYTGLHHIQDGDPASLVGDEMAMQYAYCKRQGLDKVEFVVCQDRALAALRAQELGVDFIISDDGLQHYKMPRHLEIAVIGKQGLGNQLYIPAGPLREDPERLEKVDFIVNNSQDPRFGGARMEQFNLGFLPVKLIEQPSNPAKVLHIVANWHNYLIDSEQMDNYLDLLDVALDEHELETKYQDHLIASQDLSHLRDKDSHSAKAWNEAGLTTPDQALANQQTTEQQTADSSDALQVNSAQASSAQASSAQASPATQANSASTTTSSGDVFAQEKTSARFPGTGLSTSSPKHPERAPTFKNAEEFIRYINQQIDPKALTVESLTKRAKAFLNENNVLVEQMIATFPKVVAMCAIGNPEDFRNSLESLGFEVVELFKFRDHHSYSQADLDAIYSKHPDYKAFPLIVTEKDAIKLKDLELPQNCFFLEREGYFEMSRSWLEKFKEKMIEIYISSIDNINQPKFIEDEQQADK